MTLRNSARSGSGDLWSRFGRCTEGMRQPSPQKIKSHRSFAEFITATPAQRQGFVNNMFADLVADAAASLLAAGKQDIVEGFRVEKLCRDIALRISLVELRCRQFKTLQSVDASVPAPVPPAVAQHVVTTVLASRGHRLARAGKKLICLGCGKQHSAEHPERWLLMKCTPGSAEAPSQANTLSRKRKGESLRSLACRILGTQSQTQLATQSFETIALAPADGESTDQTAQQATPADLAISLSGVGRRLASREGHFGESAGAAVAVPTNHLDDPEAGFEEEPEPDCPFQEPPPPEDGDIHGPEADEEEGCRRNQFEAAFRRERAKRAKIIEEVAKQRSAAKRRAVSTFEAV